MCYGRQGVRNTEIASLLEEGHRKKQKSIGGMSEGPKKQGKIKRIQFCYKLIVTLPIKNKFTMFTIVLVLVLLAIAPTFFGFLVPC